MTTEQQADQVIADARARVAKALGTRTDLVVVALDDERKALRHQFETLRETLSAARFRIAELERERAEMLMHLKAWIWGGRPLEGTRALVARLTAEAPKDGIERYLGSWGVRPEFRKPGSGRP